MMPAFWDGREERDVLRVCVADGRTLTGSTMRGAGQHFIICRGRDMRLHGHTEGPLKEMEILFVTVEQSRAEVREAARLCLFGEPVSGLEPVTREDYQHRPAGADARGRDALII